MKPLFKVLPPAFLMMMASLQPAGASLEAILKQKPKKCFEQGNG